MELLFKIEKVSEVQKVLGVLEVLEVLVSGKFGFRKSAGSAV
jgi:hypothetical protein